MSVKDKKPKLENGEVIEILQKIKQKLYSAANEYDGSINTTMGITKPLGFQAIATIFSMAFSKKEDLAFITNALNQQRVKLIEEFKDLMDEYNDMDDNAIQFELRIRQPKLNEFLTKLKKLEE